MEKMPIDVDTEQQEAPASADEMTEEKTPIQHTKKYAKARENLSVLWTFLSTFVVTCVVIVALALVVVKVTGCYLFTIETGSMTPAYPVGTVVVVKPYSSFDEIQVGDVVTYVINEEGSTVTHRAISIDSINETVTTQGDANDTADASPVLYGNIIGKVIIGIPKLGGAVKMITNEDNRPVIIAVIVLLLAWALLGDVVKRLIRKVRRRKAQKTDTQTEDQPKS